MAIPAELASNARQLIEHLRKVEVGKPIPYESLTAVIGADVQQEAAHSLKKAREVLERDEGIRFDVERGKGLIRMSDAQVVKSGEQSLTAIRRKVKRESQKMACVSKYDELSNEEKISLNTTRSMLGALGMFTKEPTIKTLGESVAKAQKQIGAGSVAEVCKETLEKFQKPKT